MRLTLNAVLAACIVAIAVPAYAELQNVEVGGSLRIRGNYYSAEAVAQPRPRAFNPFAGAFLFSDTGHSAAFVEQRTTVSVSADFTDDVSAFIELDSYEIWGTNFRDSYIFSANAAQSAVANDVDVYQAYIEMREAWGYPLTIKIGRQEIKLGSEWLVGNNDTAAGFTGLSFDGITANYAADAWNVTALWSKLAEKGAVEEDGDLDMYGLYFTYTGLEDWTIDAYWLYVRDAAEPVLATANGGLFGGISDTIEDAFGVDQYEDVTTIHTFGLRGAGTFGQFDFEGEIAYQTGNARSEVAGDLNAGFAGFFNPDPASLLGNVYGEDDAEYDHIGLNLELGYTFDTSYQPRIYLGAAFFEGEDDRDDGFFETLVSTVWPFAEDDASISFNRLFSDWEYSEFLSNTDLSNALILRGGVEAQLSESIHGLIALTYFQVDEPSTTNGVLGIPFFGSESDDDLGWEIGLYLDYAYSEDLTFSFGYAHFFAGDGVNSNNSFFLLPDVVGGNFFGTGGLTSPVGISDDDADYLFFETSISF
jgi:hypothetical protein